MKIEKELMATVGLWLYEDCHRAENRGAHDAHLNHGCGACGKRDLRLIHALEHALDMEFGPLNVCVECARILIGNVEWDIPGDAEKTARLTEGGRQWLM